MSPKFAETLMSYDYWANHEVIKALETFGGNIPDELLETLSHILGAKQIWYNRFNDIPTSKDLFKKEELSVLKQNNESVNKIWIDYILRHSPESTCADYTNLAGEPFKNSLSEVIAQLSHHGSYHRGQISRIIRECGEKPVSTDFIIYCRQSF